MDPRKSQSSNSQTQSQPSHKVYHKNLDSFPIGYKFCPLDHELIIHYLAPKLANQPLPPNQINEVNIYESDPMKLSETYKAQAEGEWYFHTPRDRKYKNGDRPNRAAGKGYWKATGKENSITHEDVIIGYKRALVYYKGKPPSGEKTDWIMHEYRVHEVPKRQRDGPDDMRLDDTILCKLYKKKDKASSSKREEESVHKDKAI